MLHSYIFHYMTVSIIRYKYNKIYTESPIYSMLSAYFLILLYLQEKCVRQVQVLLSAGKGLETLEIKGFRLFLCTRASKGSMSAKGMRIFLQELIQGYDSIDENRKIYRTGGLTFSSPFYVCPAQRKYAA